jgi:hypothetical protein
MKVPKKVFRFHAKRGQQDMVIELLRQYGQPWTTPSAEGIRVFVELPEGVSKRSVDKMLRDAGVPGAASCRNVPLIRVGRDATGLDDALERLFAMGYLNRKVKISWAGRRVEIGYLRAEDYCDGPGFGLYVDPDKQMSGYQLPTSVVEGTPGQKLPWC